jgi:hypothetical protein
MMDPDGCVNGKVRFNAKSITDNIFKIKKFVDNLMDFSKPEPEYISYDIKHLIDDSLLASDTARFKLVHFTIDLADDIHRSKWTSVRSSRCF